MRSRSEKEHISRYDTSRGVRVLNGPITVTANGRYSYVTSAGRGLTRQIACRSPQVSISTAFYFSHGPTCPRTGGRHCHAGSARRSPQSSRATTGSMPRSWRARTRPPESLRSSFACRGADDLAAQIRALGGSPGRSISWLGRPGRGHPRFRTAPTVKTTRRRIDQPRSPGAGRRSTRPRRRSAPVGRRAARVRRQGRRHRADRLRGHRVARRSRSASGSSTSPISSNFRTSRTTTTTATGRTSPASSPATAATRGARASALRLAPA